MRFGDFLNIRLHVLPNDMATNPQAFSKIPTWLKKEKKEYHVITSFTQTVSCDNVLVLLATVFSPFYFLTVDL